MFWKRECDQRIGNFGAEGASAAGCDYYKLFACFSAEISDGSRVSVGFESGNP